MVDALSAVLGTVDKSKGIRKQPCVLGAQVTCRKAMEGQGTERIGHLMRETAATMATHFILRRVVNLKSSGQKIRNNRRMTVLNAPQLRNDSWKQTREERGGSN